MSIEVVPIRPGQRWHFQWFNQWGDVFNARKCNWVDFTFFTLECEYATYLGQKYEVTVIVLGLGVRVSFKRRDNARMMQMVAEMDQIKAGFRDGKSPEEMGLTQLFPPEEQA